MARLIWSARALDDLEAACEYIARDSDRYARLFAERIVRLAESIPRNPLRGAVVREYQQEDLRERLFQNYRIVYRLREDAIDIVTIVHAARLLPPLPPCQGSTWLLPGVKGDSSLGNASFHRPRQRAWLPARRVSSAAK